MRSAASGCALPRRAAGSPTRAPRRAAAGVALLCLLAAAPAPAVVLPPDFVSENVTPDDTFDTPVGIAFMPDGRILVAEQAGRVQVIRDGVKLPTPMWDGTGEVLQMGDRGLLGIAVDPHYALNHYLYLLYTVDPDSDAVDTNMVAFGRLTRYQVSGTDSNLVDPTTRAVLMGVTWPKGPCSGSITHAIGSLRWGADGSLLVSAGEGAEYSRVDAGGLKPALFEPGRTDPYEDIGAYRAQFVGSLAGKILRLDPATGRGYPSNPYWNGDPDAPRSKVWAYGLRNPYRFNVRPGTGAGDPALGSPGTLYIGDVGWGTWEEVDVANQPGMNFGWPCYEGFASNTQYLSGPQPSHCACGGWPSSEDPVAPTPPIVVTNHLDASQSVPPGWRGSCVIGGTFYSARRYPPPYRDGFYFADCVMKTIRVAQTSSTDSLLQVLDFASDVSEVPVDLIADPVSGDVFYTGLSTGLVYRIRYTGTVAAEPGASAGVSLSNAFPNPTGGRAAMELALSKQARVGFAVLDVTGRAVWSAPAREIGAGRWTLAWPGEDRDGHPATPGLYFARATVEGKTLVRRFALVR
ncbi:MAG: PQQ-dependent sugar dehydrogenase [Candidatus Eisenbacteria bacterium]|nr:PQQ-dependent sugar dehydrogenase [Candidatus Eisenbacteria bacterium]